MPTSLKYAVVERERRYLVASLPAGVTTTKEIIDRYLIGTRMRLREVRQDDGTVIRKLEHKVRLTEGPAEVACTNFYLDAEEFAVLAALPARTLRKRRHLVAADGWVIAVDEREDGTLVAEIDDGERPSTAIPDWLQVISDVTNNETWTGEGFAGRRQAPQ